MDMGNMSLLDNVQRNKAIWAIRVCMGKMNTHILGLSGVWRHCMCLESTYGWEEWLGGIMARWWKGPPVRTGNGATQTSHVGKGIPVGRGIDCIKKGIYVRDRRTLCGDGVCYTQGKEPNKVSVIRIMRGRHLISSQDIDARSCGAFLRC